jgi:hypothetical protein
MFRQINPTIPMITPLGYAHAHFIWGNDRLVWFGVFQEETGENWWWLNNFVRLMPSISDDQFTASQIKLPKDMEESLVTHRQRHPQWNQAKGQMEGRS